MRVNSSQLIKFLGTLTVPAAETKSIGLRADARVVMVFATPPRQLYRDVTNHAHLSGLVHLDNFIMTRHISSVYRDCAKTNPTVTQTATNHTAGR